MSLPEGPCVQVRCVDVCGFAALGLLKQWLEISRRLSGQLCGKSESLSRPRRELEISCLSM